MDQWNDLFVAVAGASAALGGLIFVGISISLTKILSLPILVNRAVISMILLLTILVIAVILLMPRVPVNVIAYLVGIIGLTAWILITRIDVQSLRVTEKQYKRQYYFSMLFNQLSVIPYLISGFVMLFFGAVGLYWIVPAILISFIKAVSEAWILLVEINR